MKNTESNIQQVIDHLISADEVASRNLGQNEHVRPIEEPSMNIDGNTNFDRARDNVKPIIDLTRDATSIEGAADISSIAQRLSLLSRILSIGNIVESSIEASEVGQGFNVGGDMVASDLVSGVVDTGHVAMLRTVKI